MAEMAGGSGNEGDEPIPLSALQHAAYCLRQAALIHLERLWEENRFTAEGKVLHAVAEAPDARKSRGVRRVMALPLASRRLGIAGIADLVEFHKAAGGPDVPYPVEYKRGKPKLHRADEIQLCAQALCLEEMTGAAVPEGALYYAETRRRLHVPIDAGLRQLTEDTIVALADIFANRKTPPPTLHVERCRACSLIELCRPAAMRRSAKLWRDRSVAAQISGLQEQP